MRKRWIATLALSFGFLTTTARAGNDPWQAPPPNPPVAQIGRPIVVDDEPARPLVDRNVKPVGYDAAPATSNPANGARPLPIGSPAPASNMYTWKQPDVTIPTPPGAPPATASGNSIGKPVAVDGDPVSPPVTGPPPDTSFWGRLSHPFAAGDWDCGGCGAACGVGDICCGNGCYNPGNRWYADAEVLLWWMKGNRVPPLVTTGSVTDTIPGALGQPGTQVLIGGGEVGSGMDVGGRFTLGFWFTRDHCLGFEGNYWFLGTKANDFSESSQGNPPLFRPFVNETGAQDVELVAVPSPTGPGLAGNVSVFTKTTLWGTEGNFRSSLWCNRNCFIDGLLGFRAMGLDDSLDIHESLVYLRGAVVPDRGVIVPAGTAFDVRDSFRTVNRFYGGQVGLDMEARKCNWIFGLKTKVALGATNETVMINGGTLISVPGQTPAAFNGGLLAQNSNIGHFSRNVFAVVPEVGVSVGYQFNPHWRAFVGYNFMYWSSVARSGDQIDLVVNRNQIPPPAAAADRPAAFLRSTDFWAQGVNLGLEFKW